MHKKSKKGTGSEIDVPTPVLKTFNTKYRMAKKVIWSQEEENYRADFKMGEASVNTSVAYSSDGKMLYIEKDVAKAQYNKTALKYISEEYAGYKVTSMRKHDTYDKKTTYITMIRKSKEILEVEFDKKGGFIRDTDRTPVTASKKKAKKVEEEEESTDEEKPAKKDTKVKEKAKKDSEEEEDAEEATPAPKKETKAKAPTKKTDEETEDSEEAKPAPKKEKAKPAPKPKKSSKDDEDEDEDE